MTAADKVTIEILMASILANANIKDPSIVALAGAIVKILPDLPTT